MPRKPKTPTEPQPRPRRPVDDLWAEIISELDCCVAKARMVQADQNALCHQWIGAQRLISALDLIIIGLKEGSRV